MTAEELYEKYYGNANSLSKKEVIILLKHFAHALQGGQNKTKEEK